MHMRNVYLIFTKTHHFCEYGFSVSALWCPLATPTVLLGFLLPWAWSISSQLLRQSAAAAPYLGRGVSPHCHPSWPLTWDSSSRPSCVCAATAPWTWGCSFQPPPLASSMGARGSSSLPPLLTSDLGSSSQWFLLHRSLAFSATAPDFRRGVAHRTTSWEAQGAWEYETGQIRNKISVRDTFSRAISVLQNIAFPCIHWIYLHTYTLIKSVCISLFVIVRETSRSSSAS